MPRAARILPCGLTIKEERFCCAYFSSGNAEQSYRKAYDVNGSRPSRWVRNEAHELLHRPHIKSRIEDLRQQAESIATYKTNDAFREAGEALLLAKRLGQPAAIVSAVTLRAKLAGLLVDRQDITNRTIREMTTEDLEEQLMKAAEEAGYIITKAKNSSRGGTGEGSQSPG
ncbi:MAG: hypothetical protein FJW39_34415 [Acidobacteria bacterium]|nr:hypothetical protein [Acidobacteriota bacterium]